MSLSFKLFRLQQIDSEIDKGQARIKEIDRLMADDNQVSLSQLSLDNVKKLQFEAERDLRFAEQNVQEQRLKIERSQAALYGGKITNPKELQDLQHESESLKKYLGTLEDLQLEAMLALDEAEANFVGATEHHSTVKSQVAEEYNHLSVEKSRLLQDIERQENERHAASANLEAADLRIYETLRKKKNGIAVARVLEKTCGACGSTLSATVFSSAQVPLKLTRCSTCGRILYVG